MSVKLIMVSLYCKVSFKALNDQKTKYFMSMKSALEVYLLYYNIIFLRRNIETILKTNAINACHAQ
jgi:hypothetical protein